jgi:cytoskeletal protein CcmA (bactofilin family)
MFRKSADRRPDFEAPERVDSVLGPDIAWQGQLSGTGGVRVEGAFDGAIALRGLLVIGPQGRVTCEHIRAVTVVVAGSVKGNITAQRVEITHSGRVWGDVVTTSFSTEEGAFLRGQIRMEEELDLGLGPPPGGNEQAPEA